MILSPSFRRAVTCAVALLTLACAACGGSDKPKATDKNGGSGGGAGQSAAGQGGSSLPDTDRGGGLIDAGSPDLSTSGAGGSETKEMMHTISISPTDVTVHVSGKTESVQFNALLDGVQASAVNWSVDDVLVGVIDSSGNFHAFGDRSGVLKLTARIGALVATTTITVQAALSDNPSGISAQDIDALRNGGTADKDFAWLYPYDGTVFPEGLGAPLLQFAGSAADSLFVQVTFTNFSFEGFYPATAPSAEELDAGASSDRSKWPLRVTLPQEAWSSIGRSTNGTEDVSVKVTKLSGGQVSGPVTEHWRIAEGELQGVVYYNTYNSGLPGIGGAIMRVPLGGGFEPLKGLAGSDPSIKCIVCHSVSANGKVLAAAIGWSEDPPGKNSGNPLESAAFNLNQDGTAAVRTLDKNNGRKFAFGGLSPDGEWMLTDGVPDVPLDDPRVRGLSGFDPDETDDFVITAEQSALVETSSGAVIDTPNFSDKVKLALTPQFSPDGTALAFSWYDDSPGRTLGVASFQGGQSPPKLGAATAVLRSDTEVLAWPSFTPDSKGLLFHAGDGFDTNRHGGGAFYAQIRLLDLDGNVSRNLNALNGFDAKGNSYLPYAEPGQENDVTDKPLAFGTTHMNYEPNVLPVAIGGYYWVFFTSRRTYGNAIAPGSALPLSDKPFGNAVPSPRKKIWVAAVDIDFHGKIDPSHPAFYLPGQELVSGNMRAFAALAPCRANGAKCSSGVQCCDGFCRNTAAAGADVSLQCVPPPKDGCSNSNEACSTAADCCDVHHMCINKRCAQLTPD